jgi:hypothetical protein
MHSDLKRVGFLRTTAELLSGSLKIIFGGCMFFAERRLGVE